MAVEPLGPAADLRDTNQTIGVFRLGEREFGQGYKDAILKDMTLVGYDLTEIGLAAPQLIQFNVFNAPNVVCLYVKEASLKGPTEQFEISQGMFRALAILIHLNYGILSGNARCVMIDDIGEGLDFDRASSLIKVLVEKCKVANLQLILATNDRFVMNAVPIDYWTVLGPNGGDRPCI